MKRNYLIYTEMWEYNREHWVTKVRYGMAAVPGVVRVCVVVTAPPACVAHMQKNH